MSDKTREKIFMAIGEASMCWAPKPTGVFDSTAAQKIGERLVADLSRHEATEPLAVAISKAGYWHHKVYEMADGNWMIIVGTNFRNDLSTEERFEAPTYAAAEAAARQYLEGLEDKGGKI